MLPIEPPILWGHSYFPSNAAQGEPMPPWGLTAEQRDTSPWGLPGHLLKPGKVITDPVWGDIYLNRLEVAIIDSPSYQRLRRVRQLGTTHLVYPGATHSRFSHSLGAVWVAQALLEQITNQREGLHATKDDLLAEWTPEGGDHGLLHSHVARATVLGRLGALLHDLCHVPVGHSVEDDLKLFEPHDFNLWRFEKLWLPLKDYVLRRLQLADEPSETIDAVGASLLSESGELYQQLLPLILSKNADGNPRVAPKDMTYPFVADLVGNTICADLLDYLSRDHMFTGLPASLGRRFISGFYIVPSDRGPYSRRLALNIMRDGHERSDVVTELLKALRYRYELSERALVHHAKLSGDAMLGEALERWEGALWLQAAAGRITAIPGHEPLLARRDVNSLKKLVRKAHGDKVAEGIQRRVRAELETVFLKHGDDGLLEHMEVLDQTRVRGTSVREQAEALLDDSAGLASKLLNRNLFRKVGRVGAGDAATESTYETFGDAVVRDGLERDAARFAGLDDGPHVVLWLPEPEMRLKLAEVLVRHEAGIGPFVEYERSRSKRGSDIYDAHSRLWALYAFVDRDVPVEQQQVIATYLAGIMGVRWEQHIETFGPRPHEWTNRLAVHRVKDWSPLDPRTDRAIAKLPAIAARAHETFDDLCGAVERI